MLLASNHFTPVLGVDIHFTLMGNPFHPYIGIVIDPFDYIPHIGSSVHVNGIKRANSTTQGVIIPLFHFSLFGGLFLKATPPAPIRMGESMNFFGSQNVYTENARFTPKGFFVMTCNDIGIPLSLAPGKSWKSLVPSLFMPLAGSLPISFGNPVNVGPPYVPDTKSMLTNLAQSMGFGYLLKYGGKLVKKGISKLNNKFLKPGKLKDFLCKYGFEPINLINGAVFYEGTDFEIPSPQPIKWERQWYSDSAFKGWLGHGVHCNYDRCVEIDHELDVVGLRMEDGRMAVFSPLAIEEQIYLRDEKITVTRYSNHYQAFDHTSFTTYIFDHYNGYNQYRMTQIIDKAGLTTRLYLNGDHLLMIEDCAGRKIKAYTNSIGLITQLSLIHQKGEDLLISYSYDQDQNMIRITDALQKSTHIKYQNHLMIEKTDRNGQTFYWEYDGTKTGAKCTHTWGDGGWQEGWIEYFPEKGYNLVRDANQAVTTYYYEPNQLVTQVTDPLGNSHFTEYTEYMEIYRQIDPEGHMTGYTYDEFGNKTSIVYPDASVAQYIYDKEQRLSIVIDPEGNQTTYTYKKNQKYLLNSIIEPDNGITQLDYNPKGLISEISKEGNRSKLEYDAQHNLISFTDHEGNATLWDYNYRGEVISVQSPGSNPQTFGYDILGRITSIKGADHNVTTLVYNAYDEVIEAQDQHHTIKFDYTPLGSLKMREENKTKVFFDYDKMEQLVSITNEHNEKYRFTRNKAGHITQEEGFDALTRRYQRNANGWVVRTQRPENRWSEYQYDALGRIVRAHHNDGTWESFAYNKLGQLLHAKNQDVSILLERDKMGRVIKETQTSDFKGDQGFTIISEYDRNGNRIKMTSSLGAQVQNTYNPKGLLEKITAQTTALKEAQKQAWETQLKHNALGQEIERSITGGLTLSMQYDAAGRPIAQKVHRGHKDTYHRTYTWNANHRLQQTINALTGGQVQYVYDRFGNLASAQYEDGSYDYKLPDEVGNLYKTKEQKDRVYGKGGKLLKDLDWHYLYDAEGNLRLKSKRNVAQAQIQKRQEEKEKEKPARFSFFIEEISDTKPKRGELAYYLQTDRIYTKEEKQEYTRLKEKQELEERNNQQWQQGDWEYNWYGNGMLKSVKKPDGTLVTMEYDALGRRIKKICNEKTNRYLWDGNVLLHQWTYLKGQEAETSVNDLGEVYLSQKETVEDLVTWIYQENSFVPSAKIQGEEQFSIISDYIGRPLQCYNEKGSLVWSTDYDIYGGLRNFSSPINLTPDFIPFRQLGQYEDPELEGLYYNRFRYYDASTGLYISQDPIGLEGNNPTFYAYVHDSNSWVDPFGLELEPTVNLGTAPKGTTLYHYTNAKGYEGILESKEIFPSIKALNPKDARLGDGQYFSNIVPGTKNSKQLAASFVRVPNPHLFTHYIAIDVSGLEIHQGLNRKDVFVILGDQNLDISNRIVDSGKLNCG
ncbi:HYD1 signature containing ADP-ribosyltransferase family protein [Flavobacterium covae]|uniref:HYD1 signature containing ADP-ribosyltransferase family protein n=2 Tax=Flavobacterium covae TaxID=2906076 RepID=UPI000A69F1F8|nr:HYD1 signature containing ADP-ribosyltransferase family protein [Flavobacterium covae]